jgi:hypothetical protein
LNPSSGTNSSSDAEYQQLLGDEKAKKSSDIKANDYSALIYVGGHEPCLDLPADQDTILSSFQFFVRFRFRSQKKTPT